MSPTVLQLALVPWEAVIYLGLFLFTLRAWARLDDAPESGGEAALGWRQGAQAISVSTAGTLIALAFMAVTLLGLAGGATLELLPKGMTVLQVIILIGGFDAVVATGAATFSVAVTPRWLRLEDQARDRAVLLRLMTARSWLFFALARLILAAALITLDPEAGMTRHVDKGESAAPVREIADLSSKLAGMEALIAEISRVKLPELAVKFDAATQEIKTEIDKAVAAGKQAAGWPNKKLAPEAMRLRAALDQLKSAFRAEIEVAPVGGHVRSAALGPSMISVLESFAQVMDSDQQSADTGKTETIRALLGLLQPMARRMGIENATAQGRGQTIPTLRLADLPPPITFSFPSGGNSVPEKTDDGRSLMAAFDDMSAFIRDHAACLVMVEGHADAKGREDTNLLLSLQRAEGVAGPLRGKLGSGHVITVPRGESEPLVKTKDGVEKPENRRVRVAAHCPEIAKTPGNKAPGARAEKVATAN